LAFALGHSFLWNFVLQQLNIEYEDTKQAGFPTSFNQFHEMSKMFALKGLMWLYLLASIGFSLYFLREIGSAFGDLTPFRKLTKLLRHAFLWTTKLVSLRFGGFDMLTWAEEAGNLVTKFCLCFKAVSLFPPC
jgi:hypothetical protein